MTLPILYTFGMVVLNMAVLSCGWYAVWNMRIKKIPFVIKFFELDSNSGSNSITPDENNPIPTKDIKNE